MTQPVASPGAAAPTAAPAPAVPRRATCPICATTFDPRATTGRCPVCGEQVIPEARLARDVPVVSPAARWLLGRGNWRAVAVALLIVYQLVLFIILWIHLASIHAL